MNTLSLQADRHALIRILTERSTQFVDLTDEVQAIVERSGVDVGLVNVQSMHTTTAIVVNEHEPLLLEDVGLMLEFVASRHGRYRHDRRPEAQAAGERINGFAHCRSVLLGTSACLNVAGGRLVLGRWQRLFLAEFDGPQPREISVVVCGEGRP
jgi:secondary thiamine-phosphate synthase enzyme